MNANYEVMFALLRSSLFGMPLEPHQSIDVKAVYQEMQMQEITCLPCGILGEITELDAGLLRTWKDVIIKTTINYHRILYVQEQVSNLLMSADIPFVIIKGVSAAMNYPDPRLRTMGDIDILVATGAYIRAIELMKSQGYVSLKNSDINSRHTEFKIDQIEIELHQFFSSFNDTRYSQNLELFLQEGIVKRELHSIDQHAFYTLPALQNGLVLLQHMSFHMEKGIGLRHVVDWMMFVSKYLDDEFWRCGFQRWARELDLEILAKTVTRICQQHLGLDQHILWCADADVALCERMLDYIVAKGSFGRKNSENEAVITLMRRNRNPISWFATLHRAGVRSWPLLKRAPWLKPFAWIYQTMQYARKALRQPKSISCLLTNMRESREVDSFLIDLHVRQRKYGVTRMINGVFTNEDKSQ